MYCLWYTTLCTVEIELYCSNLYTILFPVYFVVRYETVLWYFNESDPTAFLVDDLKIFLVFLSFHPEIALCSLAHKSLGMFYHSRLTMMKSTELEMELSIMHISRSPRKQNTATHRNRSTYVTCNRNNSHSIENVLPNTYAMSFSSHGSPVLSSEFPGIHSDLYNIIQEGKKRSQRKRGHK